MSERSRKVLEQLSPRKVLLPTAIGFGVVLFIFLRNFDRESLRAIQWTWSSVFWIGVAILIVGVRQFSYMIRIKILTEGRLNWRQCFEMISLWEFGSAVTPTSVGGTAVALFLLNREGIKPGKTGVVILTTILLDGFFFLLAMLLSFLILDYELIFPAADRLGSTEGGISDGWFAYFLFSAAFILGYTGLVFYGLMINPNGFKWLLIKLTSLPFTKRWRQSAIQTGYDMEITSRELRKKPFSFWIKAFIPTAVAWTSRFLVVNALLMAIIPFHEHLAVFARQLVMTMIMMVSPTPGGSGVAEVSFFGFFVDLIPAGISPIVAAFWRLFTYYIYLFLGVLILPEWLKRVYKK